MAPKTGKPVEINCLACGKEALIRREPDYDGFKKIGEKLYCSVCGYEYASESEVPFKQSSKPNVFSEADKARKVNVFREEDKGRTCRICAHYTVNPFTQRCGLTNKIVQATDTCAKFELRKEAPTAKPT